ncbi:hypothetical protein PENSPDRAFT_680226 [Peniophora sp. CONT]|nr:hypothetical protein PENSPDRAFT_680226 [Peniophora sp. CONT]
MAYSSFPYTELFTRLVRPNGVDASDFKTVPYYAFPSDDLPPLRRSSLQMSVIHPYHLLLPSRWQVLHLPNYTIRVRNSIRVLFCDPKYGRVLLPSVARRLLDACNRLRAACETHNDGNWQRLGEFFNHGQALPGPVPALWTVHLAAGNATISRVVEHINHTTNVRLYAVLKSLMAWDAEHVLFEARILGSGYHELKCIVKMPFDFVDPALMRSTHIPRSNNIEWRTEELLHSVLM